MQKIISDSKTRIILVLIALAALSRLLPHPDNFAPIGAIALFGGCYITDRRLALLLPAALMFFSDLLLELFFGNGFHPIMIWVYVSFIVIACLGFILRGRTQAQTIMVASLTGSVLFFLITNFGQWVTGYYGYTFEGLSTSYVNAIPFFRGTVMGDLFYNAVLFGSFGLIRRRYPLLKR